MERIGPDALSNARLWRDRLNQSGWWHSFELPDGRSIQGANTIESLRTRVALFPIPQDLRGKRVLDIGAWDGWFSFEMERRGASVVSVDAVESKNFRYLHRELNSKIDYRILDMYELTPATLGGTFDIVLFLGVLYHLKHPLLGIERVCALTRDLAVIQTFVSSEPGSPVMEFFEIDELGGQFDNWCAPNPTCVMAMARTAGFARAELVEVNSVSSATIICYRHFPEGGKPVLPPPVLAACIHAVDFGVNFRSDRDEYASAWFTTSASNLTRADVQVKVDPFHAAPVAVDRRGDAWQVIFKIPPGITGRRPVQIRTTQTDWSNPCDIFIDMPVEVESLAITGAADGRTWTKHEVQTGPAAVLAIWIDGLPVNRDHRNLHIQLGPYALEADSIEPWESGKPGQVNVRLPEEVAPGTYALGVAIGGAISGTVQIVCR